MQIANQIGRKLSHQEMKELKGGQSSIGNHLWYCLIEPGYSDYVCYPWEPSASCHYSEPCVHVSSGCTPAICVS